MCVQGQGSVPGGIEFMFVCGRQRSEINFSSSSRALSLFSECLLLRPGHTVEGRQIGQHSLCPTTHHILGNSAYPACLVHSGIFVQQELYCL